MPYNGSAIFIFFMAYLMNYDFRPAKPRTRPSMRRRTGKSVPPHTKQSAKILTGDNQQKFSKYLIKFYIM